MPNQLLIETTLYPGWLTADIPGTGGIIRAEPEDFVVVEIPAYGPTGQGQHTLFEIRKTGLSTMQAIQRLARAWNCKPRRIGSAGLKDRHAVTQQHLSVDSVDPETVLNTQVEGIEILWAEKHRNRLKIGHLRGNRFAIRVRDVAQGAEDRARRVLGILAKRGVPNGFGPQRFGARGTSHLLGHALLSQDADAFCAAMLGGPKPSDPDNMQQARALVDAGDLAGALALWSPRGGQEFHLLRDLVRGDDPESAVRRLPRSLSRLLVSAYQAFLFNQLVAQRMPLLGRLELGDLAIKHTNGAFFSVDDPAVEQPRSDALEISPSGALPGRKVRLATEEPGERERALLSRYGMTEALWKASKAPGDRRALRVPVKEPMVEMDDMGLVLRFDLPSGAYATNVIGEVTKAR